MPNQTSLTADQYRLVKAHTFLAVHLAVRYWKQHSNAFDREEAIAIAYQGLIAAAQRFDPLWRPDPPDPNYNPDLAFGSFAKRKMMGAILDWQRVEDHASRSQRANYKMLIRAGYGHGRTITQLVEETGMTVEKISIITAAVELGALSLDDEQSIGPGNDRVGSIEGAVFVTSIQAMVADTIEGFDPLQRSLVTLRFFEGWDFPAICAELGVSPSTARMAYNEALVSLHAVLRVAVET